MSVFLTSKSQSRMDTFGVQLRYDQEAAGCMELSGAAKATVNGVAADLSRGGTWSNFPLNSGTHCDPPFFTFPADAVGDGETTLTLEDGDAAIAVVTQNLGSPAAVTMTPPADGHLRPGSTVGLTWAPASDDVSQMEGTMFGPLPMATATHVETIAPGSFQQGFTIPLDMPPGQALLQFSGRRAPQVLRCEGVETCDLGYFLEPDQSSAEAVRAAEVQIQIEP
jgi:hypothetical protein